MIKSHIVKFLTVPCLFISLTVTSKEHKFLILIMFINFFHGLCFCVMLTHSLPNPRSYRFFPVLSSKTFYTLCLTFIFIIQFRLLFNKVLFLSRDSFSFFCLLMFNYFNTYVERLSFLYLIAFSSL